MKIKKWNGSAWVQDYPEVNVSSIVATGTPSSSTFLRGDGTWATPADVDTNNYLTGVSGSGNGTVTFTRQGLTNLTWDASHTHTFASLTSKPTTLSGFGITDGIPYNDVLMPTNPFGGKKLYINSIDNAMHSADKKWYVTATRHSKVHNSVTYPILNTGYRSIYTYTTSNNTTFTLDQTPLPSNVVVYLSISGGGTMATQVVSAPSGNTQYTYNNTTGAIVFGAARPDSTIYVYAHPDVPQYLDSPSLGTVSASAFFDGNYEGGVSVATTEYLKIRITPGNNVTTSFSSSIGYPYGSIYLSHYYDGAPETEYLRTYNYSYAAQGIGWKQVTFSNFVNDNTNVNFISQAANDSDFGRSVMEIIVVSKAAKAANLNEIDWRLSRPDLASSGSTVTKYGQNKLFSNLLFGQQSTLMELSATGGWIRTSDNSAAAPAFSFINDTDTGMFRPAADTLAFAEGGSEVIRITSNGRVGIGATVPDQLLHVGGAINLHSQITWFNGNADINGADTNLKFRTYTGSALTEKMIITSAGNVGIGRSDPQDILNIHNTSANANIGFKITRGSQTHGLRLGVNDSHAFLWTSENQDLAFATNNLQRLTITSSGNVGVGVTSPTQLFHLKKTGTDNFLKIDAGGQSTNTSGLMLSEDGINFGFSLRFSAATDTFYISKQDNTPTFTDLVTIPYNGNVGIGTSPSEKLDVNGVTRASRFTSTVATGTAPLTVSSTTVVTNLNADLLDGLDSSAYLRDDGWNTVPGQDANTQPNMKADFTYANNAPWTGSLVSFGAGAYQMQFNAAYGGDGEGISYRTRNGDLGTWNNWNRIFHDDWHPNADTLTTARTLTIGSTGKTFNGSADVSWSLTEIGAAPLSSPALTGTPTAPTATAGTNTTQIATTAFVSTAVANLINSAPGALDTLDELAAALGDDANFASTVTTALAGKASTVHTHTKSDITDFGHTHGNITNDGAIASATVTPGDGDRILIADASGATFGKIERGIIIGTGTTTFLRNDGQWATPADTTTLTSLGLTATATELNYVDGVTSAIQTQIDNKASLTGATFTGDVYAPRFIANPSSGGNDTSGAWGIADYDDKLSAVRDYITDTYYPIYHTGNKPAVADVTGLQTALDGKASTSHTHAATDITSGTIATARLGSGTANTTTFLRGDNTWSTAGIATYSTATLYVKRIWSRSLTAGAWTSRYNAGTGAGTAISTTSTFTTIALGYTPTSTDQFMIEFSNNTSDSLEKGICIVGGGTFSSTSGMSVISYDAYETVDASQLKIAKYYAQWYITGTSLGFRYGSKVVW